MYALYNIKNDNGQTSLEFLKKISLAGCNHGIIPNLLKEKISKDQNPPIGWTINVSDYYNEKEQTVIIDIKPKNKRYSEVFLCELDKIFGFSYKEWSPIMYRLKRLYSDISPEKLNKNNFIYPKEPEIIYTMLYLSGSFKNGQLTGTWNYPGPSPTNALLLWSEAMTFFFKNVEKNDSDFLREKIKTII